MLKEKALDKSTIDTYHTWVQQGIKNDLNSVSLGPGKLPYRAALALLVFGFCSLLTGILLITLRMRHVYLWDWDSQFLGPFFFILFLLCMAGASYFFILAKRRSNKYRSQLYFKPVGDWGVNCVHKSELARQDEIKQKLKSGTTPHKTVKPRSEAYSQSGRERKQRPPPGYGRDNRAYDKSPLDAQKPFRPDDRRGPPPDRRGPPPDGRRGPPPDRRGGPPPPGVRRGPPPDDRRPMDDRPRGPPPEYEEYRGPPPGRRSPPPGGRRSPPPGGRRSPPPGGHRSPPPGGRRSPPPGSRRSPPPNGRRSPPMNGRRSPPPGRRPPGPPRPPYDEESDRGSYSVNLNRSRDEASEI